MDPAVLENPQTEQLANETALRLSRAFASMPPTYKRYIMFSDYVLLIANLKAATDYTFLGDTFSPEDFEGFKKTFSTLGLKVTEPKMSSMKSGEPFRQGLVYNPKLLEQETVNSELVLPYHEGQAIEEWVKKCEEAGFSPNAIYGKVFSFPESAIRDYLQINSGQQRNRQTDTKQSFNETYQHFIPAQPDVVAREKAKAELFNNNNQISPLTADEIYAGILEYSVIPIQEQNKSGDFFTQIK